MKALVVVGHPAPGSFCRAIADDIRERWLSAGCEVRFHDLVEEGFDPRLTAAEARGQATADPLVRQHIDELRDSDLLAVVHPNCWGAPPAIMKGWIDRVFAPDAAYGFIKGVDQGDVPVGLLATKVALVINTGNTPLEREREAFGDPLERMWRDCILQLLRRAPCHALAVRCRRDEFQRRTAALAGRSDGAGGQGGNAGQIGLVVIPTEAKRSGGPPLRRANDQVPPLRASRSGRDDGI